jgi:hypothetical protein
MHVGEHDKAVLLSFRTSLSLHLLGVSPVETHGQARPEPWRDFAGWGVGEAGFALGGERETSLDIPRDPVDHAGPGLRVRGERIGNLAQELVPLPKATGAASWLSKARSSSDNESGIGRSWNRRGRDDGASLGSFQEGASRVRRVAAGASYSAAIATDLRASLWFYWCRKRDSNSRPHHYE